MHAQGEINTHVRTRKVALQEWPQDKIKNSIDINYYSVLENIMGEKTKSMMELRPRQGNLRLVFR